MQGLYSIPKLKGVCHLVVNNNEFYYRQNLGYINSQIKLNVRLQGTYFYRLKLKSRTQLNIINGLDTF